MIINNAPRVDIYTPLRGIYISNFQKINKKVFLERKNMFTKISLFIGVVVLVIIAGLVMVSFGESRLS